MESSIHGSNKNNAQTIIDDNKQKNELNLDRQEYMQVFKIFDKDNSGTINIDQVYELINKFEDTSISSNTSNINNNQGSKDQINSSMTKMAKSNNYGSQVSKNNSSAYQNGQYSKQNSQQNDSFHNKSNNKGNNIDDPSGGQKYYSSRKNNQINASGKTMANGKQLGSDLKGSNALQLKQSQMVSGQKGNDSQHNRSPRRQSHLYNKDKYSANSGQMQIKLNGIGPNHSHHGSANGELGDNDYQNDEQSPGIINPKKMRHGQTTDIIQSHQQITQSSTPPMMYFPNGKESLKFEEFLSAENYLVLAFSMFDRQKKGYISKDDLKDVFEILGESITNEEVNTMIKIAGIKSNDKINFKEFVDFFYKAD